MGEPIGGKRSAQWGSESFALSDDYVNRPNGQNRGLSGEDDTSSDVPLTVACVNTMPVDQPHFAMPLTLQRNQDGPLPRVAIAIYRAGRTASDEGLI
jgi:hypothetical protein